MKNTALPVLLFSALAAAGPHKHDHAALHHKRAYVTNTKTVVEYTTAIKVITLTGPLPAGATAYSPEEVAEMTKEAVQPPAYTPQPPASPPAPPAKAPEAEVPQAPPAKPKTTLSTQHVKPTVPAAAPPPPPAATYPVTTKAEPPAKPTKTPVAAPPKPVPAPPKPAPAPGGGSGGANPFYPNGPKTGETGKNVRLSPFLAYWNGATIENHIGACGHVPYSDTDPLLSKSDSKGDKKFMFHPPVISGDKYTDILQYCGAIIDVTTKDGLTTTGTVVDLCEDCGGPGGIDMMKANWDEVGKNVTPGDCVYGASWVLSGWAKLMKSQW